MAILALLTRPWILLVKRRPAVVPRALADDLTLWARAPLPNLEDDEWKRQWQLAIQDTFTYLVAIGAKPAQHKSLLLGSTAALRRELRKRTWGTPAAPIPVTGSARDLGAFFNSTTRRLGGTTITRHKNAAVDALKIGKLPPEVSSKGTDLARQSHGQSHVWG